MDAIASTFSPGCVVSIDFEQSKEGRTLAVGDFRKPTPYEIGIEVTRDGVLIEDYQAFIQPVTAWGNINHRGARFIDEAMANAIPWVDVCQNVDRLFGQADIVIGHNIVHDYNLLRHLSKLTGIKLPKKRDLLCTSRLASKTNLTHACRERGFHTQTRVGLGNIHECLFGESYVEHRALPDAKASARLFRYFVEKHNLALSGRDKLASLPLSATKIYSIPIAPPETGLKLNGYQLEAVATSLRFAEFGFGGLVLGPTASGKTLFLSVRNASMIAGIDARILYVTESPRVAGQARAVFQALYPSITTSMVSGGISDFSGQIVFANRSKLNSLMQRDLFTERFDAIDVDEAHHASAHTYKKIIHSLRQQNKGLILFGETATPECANGESLAQILGDIRFIVTNREAQAAGRTVPYRLVTEQILTVNESMLMADLCLNEEGNQKKISKILCEPDHNKKIVAMFKKYASDRQTVVYAFDTAHCEILYEEFISSGINCEQIHSSDENAAMHETILTRFSCGQFPVLINVMMLTEGWDCPPVSCCIIARPASRPATLQQMIGRTARAYPGKQDALVIDAGINIESLNQVFGGFITDRLNMDGALSAAYCDAIERNIIPDRSLFNSAEDDLGHSSKIEGHCWLPPFMPVKDGWHAAIIGNRTIYVYRTDDGRFVLIEVQRVVDHYDSARLSKKVLFQEVLTYGADQLSSNGIRDSARRLLLKFAGQDQIIRLGLRQLQKHYGATVTNAIVLGSHKEVTGEFEHICFPHISESNQKHINELTGEIDIAYGRDGRTTEYDTAIKCAYFCDKDMLVDRLQQRLAAKMRLAKSSETLQTALARLLASVKPTTASCG